MRTVLWQLMGDGARVSYSQRCWRTGGTRANVQCRGQLTSLVWLAEICLCVVWQGTLPQPFFWGQGCCPRRSSPWSCNAVPYNCQLAFIAKQSCLLGFTYLKVLAWVSVETRRRMIWHTFSWFDILCGYNMVCPPQEIQNMCCCAGTNPTVPDKLFMWKDTICMVVIKASVCIHLWKHVRHHMSLICLWYDGVWIIFLTAEWHMFKCKHLFCVCTVCIIYYLFLIFFWLKVWFKPRRSVGFILFLKK